MNWPALTAARRHDAAARVPFRIGRHLVGSVARAHLGDLEAWPLAITVDARGVTLTVAAGERDATLAAINSALRDRGLVRAWRDETFAIVDPATGARLAAGERAAARFWGTLTQGVHANGYLADANGRPTHLWIAQRSTSKATDPGLFDNLVGGGVADGQTPFEALIREGWEEAGLSPAQMRAARPGRVLRLHRDIPEGLQVEDLHGHDLALPAGALPVNQDGEVAGFRLLQIDEALALARGTSMTVDAALVSLDFALRHDLIPMPEAQELSAALFAGTVGGDQIGLNFGAAGASDTSPAMSQPDAARYTPVAIALHWLLAVMIVTSFSVGLYMADLPLSPLRLKLFNWHKWAGITILALSALRLLWRLTHRPPADLPMPHWQHLAAHGAHWALYALFFAVPLMGWAYSSAAGFPVVLYGVLPLPDFVAPDRAVAEILKQRHGQLAWALAVVVVLHVAAALKHQFIDRDRLMHRMRPGRA